jgi:hypothetical protein
VAKHGEVTFTVDRPVDAVFDFLADGENDKKFSARLLEITKLTAGPVGVGTVYRSRARDLGRTASHDIEIPAPPVSSRVEVEVEGGGSLL